MPLKVTRWKEDTDLYLTIIMKKLNLSASALQKGEILTRSQLKQVLGGSGSTGCHGHGDCGGMFPICVIVTYMGVQQGACCSADQIRDYNNVCGGGSNI